MSVSANLTLIWWEKLKFAFNACSPLRSISFDYRLHGLLTACPCLGASCTKPPIHPPLDECFSLPQPIGVSALGCVGRKWKMTKWQSVQCSSGCLSQLTGFIFSGVLWSV